MQCLLDSGAEVSTITESFFNSFLKNTVSNVIDTTHFIEIKAANGLAVPYIGYVEADIIICGSKLSKVAFLIVKDRIMDNNPAKTEKLPGIIGSNIFCKLVKNWSPSSNEKSKVSLWKGVLSFYQNVQSGVIKPQSKLNNARLIRSKPLIVPARSIKNVSASCKQMSEPSTVLFEAGECRLKNGLLALPVCTNVSFGKINVAIANITNEDIILSGKSNLGVVQPINHIVDGVLDFTCSLKHDGKTINVESLQINANTPVSQNDWPEGLECDFTSMTSNEKELLHTLITKHKNVFSKGDHDLGCSGHVKHHIQTIDDVPVRLPHRRVPPNLQGEVKDHLQKWLEQGVIRKSSSPYASQVVLVRKKSGELRICLDYRALNKKTRKDAYPLPRVDECLESLHGATFFSSLDLAQGYLQCEMHPDDISKTAFRAGSGGLYEFTRMPFGLVNAPATFQRLMELCLGDLTFNNLLVYLDDILIHATTFEEMISRLDLVFTRLSQYGLKVKPKKCKLFKRSVKFLGHVVSADGITTDPDKIKAVAKMPIPTTLKQLRSFLGLASYFRRFVPSFSKIVSPLNALLSGGHNKNKNCDITDKWDEKCTEAFTNLKTALTTAPILGYPDFTKPFIVETDASLQGLGAILSQQQEHKVVIAYASRSLKPTEKNMTNYSAAKLELLALKWAVTEKFRDYLLGATFNVFTDNNPLTYIKTSKLGATEMRWLAQLDQFNFDIHYKPGVQNKPADTLSRYPLPVSSDALTSSVPGTRIPVSLKNLPVFATVNSHKVSDCSTYLPSLTPTDLRNLQLEDPVLSKVLSFIESGVKPSSNCIRKEPPKIRKVLRQWDKLKLINGILYRFIETNEGESQQLLLPEKLIPIVLKCLHDQTGHQGAERTLSLVRARCFWPNMNTDTVNYCEKCERCSIAKAPHLHVKSRMGSFLAERPLEVLYGFYRFRKIFWWV